MPELKKEDRRTLEIGGVVFGNVTLIQFAVDAVMDQCAMSGVKVSEKLVFLVASLVAAGIQVAWYRGKKLISSKTGMK